MEFSRGPWLCPVDFRYGIGGRSISKFVLMVALCLDLVLN
jgi:hypothetical protein